MKGKKFKKLISLLLALIMLLTVVPATVSAAAAEEVTVLTAKISEAVETNGKNLFASASKSVQKAGEKIKSVMNLSSNSDFEYKVLEDGTAEITGYKGKATDLVIPSVIDGYKVTSIGYMAFYDNTAITSVTITDGIVNIGYGSFYLCNSLTKIIMPDSIMNIGKEAFYGCSSLTSITIPNNVTRIEDEVFSSCTSLTNINIPDSVTSIGVNAFRLCSSLTEMVIPDSITNIEAHAFEFCTNLTSFTIANGVTSIDVTSFDYCSSLNDVNVSEGNPYFSDINGVLFNKDKTKLLLYPEGKKDSNYTIPSNVKSIGKFAFSNCSSLVGVNVPNSVTSIDKGAFSSCGSLTSIIMPNSITTIGDAAFDHCGSLTSIDIPDSVTSIGDYAFDFCGSLTSVSIPNSVTTIGQCAFSHCDSLASVTISNGVTSIGNSAFSPCNSLVSIILPNSITDMGKHVFAYCNSLTSVVIPGSVKSIKEGTFRECKSLTSITIQDGVTSIDYDAFKLCSSLSKINIPDSMKQIGGGAFSYCYSLESIIIPNSVTGIGGSAFGGCTSLTDITIPDSVTWIGVGAFGGCSSLENIEVGSGNTVYSDINGVLYNKDKTLLIRYPEGKREENYIIPDGVTSIGDSAFSGCNTFINIIIPDSVTNIYSDAFRGCKTLRSINIPKNAQHIGKYAFSSCSSLTDVYYSGTKQQWDDIDIYPYNDNLLNATLHCASGVYAGSLNKGSVGFTAFDKSYFFESSRGDVNKTLKDVTVTAGNYEEKFNDFLIVDDIPKDASVTFTKDGYNKYIIPSQVAKTLFSSDKGQQFNVYMTKSPGDGKPYVSTVFVKNSDEEAYTEVQMSSATASKGNKYDIVMSAGNVSGDTTYYLSQDSNHRISSKTGVFSAVDIVSKFNAGQDIYAYVQNGSQTSEPVKIKLEIANINIPDGTLSLIGEDRFKIKAGEGVPLVGGMEISFDGFDKIPIGVDLSGNMLKLSFGVDLRKSNSESEFKKEEWTKFKKTVSTIFSEKKPKEKKEQWDKYCELLTGDSVQSSKSKDFDIRLLGYAECYIVGNEIIPTDTCGEIVGMFSFTYNHQGVMLFAGIPYYVYLKAGADIGAKFTAMRHLPDNNVPFDFGIKINLEPALTIGGGVGVKDAISAGLYGKGAFPVSLDLSKKYGDIDMTGEVGVEGQFLWYKGKKTIYEGTVHIWEGYLGTQKESSLVKLNAVTDKLREETETTVMSRDYLQCTSGWKGGNIFTRLFSSREVSEGMEIKDLQTSVYNNSETQLVSLDDGRMMMAWIEDDADRDEYNRLRLMYSIWENGVWSEPKAVSDSGTTDSTPSLVTDGKNVYVAWQNVNYKMSQADADPIAKVLEKTEIKFAQYDSEKDEFVNVKTLTDNSSYDYLPTAAAENGECVVYWLSNSGNDLTAENSNTLHRYSLSSGKTDTVKSDMNNILGIDAIVKGGESEVSYAVDTDGNLATTEDIKAFTLKNGEQVQLSPENEEVKNADFAVAYGKLNGNDTVFFADNSNIYYRENGEVKSIFTSIRSINGDLQVLDNAEETTLMWSEITDAGTDLWVCSYSNGEWNEPVQVTDTGKLLHNISAVYHDGAIRGVLNRTDRLIKDGEYVNGATDLCAMTLSDFTELEAGFVAVDESQFVKGKETDLSVYLKNNGTKDIEKVKITLSDTLSTDITVEETVNLKSGEEKLVTVKYLVPENYGRTDLTVKAVVPGEDEIDEKDNEETVSVGFADISISDMKVEDVGRFYILTAILSNDNQTTAENVKVEVREGSKDGNVVDTVEVGNLEPGKVKSIQYIVDKTAVDYDGEKLGRIYFAAKVEESGVQARAAKTEPTEKITEDNFVGAVFEYTAPETEPEPETKPGDINGDGQVTAVDARWVLQIAAGTREVTEAGRKLADLNGDGEITAVDARWVLQIAAGTRVA